MHTMLNFIEVTDARHGERWEQYRRQKSGVWGVHSLDDRSIDASICRTLFWATLSQTLNIIAWNTIDYYRHTLMTLYLYHVGRHLYL